MTIEDQNFTIYTGNNALLDFYVYNEEVSTTPKNLTDSSITWLLYDDEQRINLVTKTTVSGIVITDALNGLFTVSLNPVDTETLSPTSSYRHEATILDAYGDVSTVTTGAVIVKRSYL